MKSPSSLVYVWYLSDLVFRGLLDWVERERGDDRNKGKLRRTPRYIPLPYEYWEPVARCPDLKKLVCFFDEICYQSQCENPSAAVPSPVLPTH